jgi:cobalt/nickel transport protein
MLGFNTLSERLQADIGMACFFMFKLNDRVKGNNVRKRTILASIILNLLLGVGPALGHFGMLIPSDSMILQGDGRTVTFALSFSHPFEGQGMDLMRPKKFGVLSKGENHNLLGSLKKTQVMGHAAWSAQFKIKRPGVYIFYMEPQPYWEPAEDTFIVHYTKTVVTAFGDDEGWDQAVGLKAEIIPLSKPYGLYTGNVFQGIVEHNGKPVPFAAIEVEYYNKDGRFTAPTPYMITQTVKADKNGVFTYAAPKAGWWGFAALSPADFKLKHNGIDKDVEIGAVIWVKFHDWQ